MPASSCRQRRKKYFQGRISHTQMHALVAVEKAMAREVALEKATVWEVVVVVGWDPRRTRH